MDIMKIKSKFMRKIVSGMLEKAIKDKFGYDVDLHLYNVDVEITDTQHTSVTFSAKLDTDDTVKIMDSIS